ncbi:MAG: hypothetical protein M1827_004288 [Pycnora praestabilis]|nr:MAG: hypothetical protein M1827_004288 [Pycnora praestabilis]
MPSLMYDGWLWVGLGALSILAYTAAYRQLHEIRLLTEVNPEPTKPNVVGQETEDALKLDTLKKLTEGSNSDLRSAAIKILCERSVSEPTFDLLLKDISSTNQTRQKKGLTALKLLRSNPAVAKTKTVATLIALVDCLCNCLDRKRYRPLNSATASTPTERKAMELLKGFLSDHVPEALSAGVVKRWLAKYPFVEVGASEEQRRAVFQQFKTLDSDDFLMSFIVMSVMHHAEGRKQLRMVGLLGSSIGEDGEGGDTWMVGGEETAGLAPGSRVMSDLGRRVTEESAEERALRRRRRDAMVLSEEGRPLTRENIIEQGEVVRNEEVDRNLEQLIGEAAMEHDTTNVVVEAQDQGEDVRDEEFIRSIEQMRDAAVRGNREAWHVAWQRHEEIQASTGRGPLINEEDFSNRPLRTENFLQGTIRLRNQSWGTAQRRGRQPMFLNLQGLGVKDEMIKRYEETAENVEDRFLVQLMDTAAREDEEAWMMFSRGSRENIIRQGEAFRDEEINGNLEQSRDAVAKDDDEVERPPSGME